MKIKKQNLKPKCPCCGKYNTKFIRESLLIFLGISFKVNLYECSCGNVFPKYLTKLYFYGVGI